MKTEFGIVNSEFGIPAPPTRALDVGGWVEFRIPNSEF